MNRDLYSPTFSGTLEFLPKYEEDGKKERTRISPAISPAGTPFCRRHLLFSPPSYPTKIHHFLQVNL